MQTGSAIALGAALALVACHGATHGPGLDAGADVSGGGSGSGGERGSGGESSTGGGGASAGGNGSGGGCAGLDYCGCAARTDCAVLSEACFCPCGEPCQPSCACVCGGGAFLGCTAASIMTPGLLEGIWLIGWSGGLNHYSWVRLHGDHSADFLDGAAIGTNAPYWPCSGRGSWVLAQKPETVFLALPAGCSTPGEALTFTGFRGPPGFPRAAVLGASLEVATPGVPLEAWKFPAAQCDEAFTTCEDPFGFPP